MITNEQRNWAHIAPFFTFMGIALIMQFLEPFGIRLDNENQPWFRRRPEYLMMGLQILFCLPMMIYWRKCYAWNWRKGWGLAIVAGVVGIGIWILPTHLYTALGLQEDGVDDPSWYKYLGLAERSEGFDAAIFKDSPVAYGVTIFCRFIRAVVVVALVEEIFWRGFLARFVVKPDGDYWKLPFGQWHWRSYVVVTLAFMSVHGSVDWLGAFFFGSIMYLVAVKTRSLFACILMHGVANLLMGCYAFTYEKFGLW